MGQVLTVTGLRKRFKGIAAVNDLTLRVPANCVYGLIGPNGAGKTTLFSLIGGFLRPDAGVIRLGERDLLQDGLPLGRIGILPQDALFQRNVPILDQLSFFLRLGGAAPAAARAEVMATLETVGLQDLSRRSVATFSHGMIKRLALAQAFLGHPELILLDEPTSGLDPEQTAVVCRLITALKSTATVLVSSHNLDQLQSICDEVAVLNRGRVVAAGPVADFLGAGRRLRLTLNRDVPEELLTALRALPDMLAVTVPSPAALTLTMSPSAEADRTLGLCLQALLAQGLVPRAIEPAQSLESEVLTLLRQGPGPLPGAASGAGAGS